MANLSPKARITIVAILAVVLAAAVAWFVQDRSTWPRGEALATALQTMIERKEGDQALAASAILGNYTETRSNASRWSGVYWGFTFAAAVLSALTGLVLKFETFLKNEGVKKDIAAFFAVTAALLITISTSGDFQRKWQSNRIAAAELERLGYELLEKNGKDARGYLGRVGSILHKRHEAIVGSMDARPVGGDAGGAPPK